MSLRRLAVKREGSDNDVDLIADTEGRLVTVDGEVALASRLDDSASPIIYMGKAPVGSATSAAVWQIAKLDTTSGAVKTWADLGRFTQIWDDRTGLTYS